MADAERRRALLTAALGFLAVRSVRARRSLHRSAPCALGSLVERHRPHRDRDGTPGGSR